MPIYEIQFTSKIDIAPGQGRKDNSVRETFVLVEAAEESQALGLAMDRSEIRNEIPGSITNIQIRPNVKYTHILLS